MRSLSRVWLLATATPWTAAYSIHGIFQARVLEWGAIAFSQSHFSHVQLCATLWAIVCQAPLSVRFFQARILEWVATFSSRGSSWSRNWTQASYVPAVACVFFTTKWLSVSGSVVSDSLWPYGLYPPGSSVHGILQARLLEGVAIPFSRGSSWPRNWSQVSLIAGRFFTV